MKKILKVGAVVLLGAGVAMLALTVVLDQGMRRAIEVAGLRLTGVAVRLDKAHLSLISGRVELEGLRIGNPEGYRSPAAIEVRRLRLVARPASLLADKVQLKAIDLDRPLITLEGGWQENNLRRILDHVNMRIEERRASLRRDPDFADEENQKLQVDELVVAGGQLGIWVNVLGSRVTAFDLPEIRLTQLGTGPEGITAAELTDRLLRVVIERATVAALSSRAAATPGAGDATGAEATGAALDDESPRVPDPG